MAQLSATSCWSGLGQAPTFALNGKTSRRFSAAPGHYLHRVLLHCHLTKPTMHAIAQRCTTTCTPSGPHWHSGGLSRHNENAYATSNIMNFAADQAGNCDAQIRLHSGADLLAAPIGDPTKIYDLALEKELVQWTERRARCRQVSAILAADVSKTLRARADRISRCADSLRVVWNSFHSRPALYPVFACGVLLCPSCGGRRYRQKKPYIVALEALAASPRPQRYLAATFTVRAVAVSHAADEIKHLHKAFVRLCRRGPLKHAAYFRATQLNCTPDGNVNPHIHSLFILPPGSGPVSVSAEDWRSAAKLDYAPAVSIRWAYQPGGWMRYITAPP